MLFTTKHKYLFPSLELNKVSINWVNTHKYLGVYLDTKLTYKNHLEHILARVKQFGNQLLRCARCTWGLTTAAVSTLINGAIQPLLFYAACCWAHVSYKTSYASKLLRVQRLFLLKKVRCCRSVSTDALTVLAGVLPWPLALQAKVLQYYVRTDCISTHHEHLLWRTGIHLFPREWAVLNGSLHPTDFHLPDVSLDPIPTTGPAIPSDVYIFTDGSKSELGVGSSVCVYTHLHENPRQILRQRYNQATTIYQAELAAIHQAVQWSLTLPERFKFISILSDSKAALTSLTSTNLRNSMIRNIQENVSLSSKCFKFFYVPGHAGVVGNEMADTAAKDASKDENLPLTIQPYSRNTLTRIIYDHLILEWNQSWTSSTKGNVTKMFYPTIYDFLRNPINNFSYSLSQILTGHGNFNCYLAARNLASSTFCSCASGKAETVQHILYECHIYEIERFRLMLEVLSLGYGWPCPAHILVSKELCAYFNFFIKDIFKKKRLCV
ncbi:uncharacterized protein LOC111629006 [Centruroides sculpturatus]|uniref:uncharacterized protein LOC111629006 n=1 Tax=Centruroides sculpturatus TaxID=218467 RepID=UPI000C6EF933|nr:uncharacterized protein LOC111629006 [Centruroides sculpturatus]